MPKCLGGLGVKDIEKFSMALRLRWLWFDRMNSEKPWVGTPSPNSAVDQELFASSVSISIGDGHNALILDISLA